MAAQVNIYNKYGGLIDGFLRITNPSDKHLMSDNDWSLIDGFEQDIKLISMKLASKSYTKTFFKKLNDNCDAETYPYFASRIPTEI